MQNDSSSASRADATRINGVKANVRGKTIPQSDFTETASPRMKHKVGRPKRILPGHYLFAKMKALSAYQQARRAGEKHGTAVDLAVDEFKRVALEFPFYNRDMRNFLTKFHPRGSERVLLVAEMTESEVNRTLARYKNMNLPVDISRLTTGLTLRIGPHPAYQRSNAKSLTRKRIY